MQTGKGGKVPCRCPHALAPPLHRYEKLRQDLPYELPNRLALHLTEVVDGLTPAVELLDSQWKGKEGDDVLDPCVVCVWRERVE